jgi:hypothetical protein
LEDIVPGMLGGTAALAFADAGMTWTLDVPLDKIVTAKLDQIPEPKAQSSV